VQRWEHGGIVAEDEGDHQPPRRLVSDVDHVKLVVGGTKVTEDVRTCEKLNPDFANATRYTRDDDSSGYGSDSDGEENHDDLLALFKLLSTRFSPSRFNVINVNSY